MKTPHTAVLSMVLVLSACGGSSGGGNTPQPPANRVPVASDQSTATNPDTTLNGTLQATDADGDSLSFALGTGPASGMVTLSGTGSQDFEYVPDTGFSGADSFTFTASDAESASNSATVTINVNTQPSATGASYSTTDIVDVFDTLAANDVEGDALTYAIGSQPARGTLSSFDAATGTFVYTPNQSENGMDSFTFTVNDGFQTSAPGTVNIDIIGWAGTQQFGSVDIDLATTGGLYFDSDGSMVFGGSTAAQITGNPSAGGRDAYLRRVDRRGNEIWTVQFGGADDDNARNIFRHPQGLGTYVVQPEQNTDGARVLLFDNNGNVTRNVAVDFGTATVVAAGYWSGIDNSGDLYLASWTDSLAGEIDSLITKVSGADGSTLWNKPILGSRTDPVAPILPDSTFVQVRSFDVDSAGNIIFAGSFANDTGTEGRPCVDCSFVASIDTDGNDLWSTAVSDFGSACDAVFNPRIYRVTVNTDDTLYAVGASVNNTNSNGAVARFNADATQTLWTHCDDTGDRRLFNFTPAQLAANGDILVYSTVESAEDPVTLLRESADLFVTRLDSDGNLVFQTVLQGQRGTGEPAILGAASIVEGPLGSIFVTGWTDGEFTAAPLVGVEDVFLLRLDADGSVR